MLKLIHRFAAALLLYAEENDLDTVYRQSLRYITQPVEKSEAPDPLGAFIVNVPDEYVIDVVERFMDLARNKINLLETEIISAVPLTQQQLITLEIKLIRMFRRQLEITTKVDPSLLGGLQVIAGETVIDDTIKRKLSDMKNSIYKGVYFKQ